MRLDKRGEAGIMEAMVAMMVATIALTAFLGVMVLTAAEENEPQISVSFLDALSIEGGEVVGIDEITLQNECARRGYQSMAVKIIARLPAGPVTLNVGEAIGDGSMGFASGTMNIVCDDGTTVVATYEVVAFA